MALAFGPPEYFAVYFLAFASFVGMGGTPPIKTLVSLAIGFALAAVGIDTVSGSVRLTMGIDEMVKGVSFVVAVMGLFGIGELLIAVEEEFHVKAISSKVEWREVFRTLAGLPRYGWALLRSAAIGCWMGITPGGPTAASFMSYGIAKRLSSRHANFGKGEPEGIVAPEAADHAAGTSALLPMLSLGIPGSATAAVMMGGLMIWGLNPGPMLFVEQKDFVWGLIASMYLGNVVAVVLVLLTVPIFAALMRVPFFIIAPVIVIICTVGAYSVSNSYLDVVLMMGFGVLGYHVQETSLPAGAAGARDRDRRQGGRCLSPVHADVAGLAWNILCQAVGDDADPAWRGAAADAGDLAHDRPDDAAVTGEAMTIAPNELTAEKRRRS